MKGRSFSTFVEKLDIIMIKSSEFHRIYEDKDGIRYPVPFHGSKEMSEGLRLRIIRDMELE